jgi:hypothetical protein
MSKTKPKDPLFWGGILIIIGGLFLLHNFQLDALHYLAYLWPVILIAWGGWKLILGLTEKKGPKTGPSAPKQGLP